MWTQCLFICAVLRARANRLAIKAKINSNQGWWEIPRPIFLIPSSSSVAGTMDKLSTAGFISSPPMMNMILDLATPLRWMACAWCLPYNSMLATSENRSEGWSGRKVTVISFLLPVDHKENRNSLEHLSQFILLCLINFIQFNSRIH